MIDFVFRMMFYGMGGSSGCCAGLCGLFGGIFAMCGLWRLCACCSRCRVRNCRCIKWWMRRTGADNFDDFEMMLLIHEVQFVTRGKKHSMIVRVTAGDHEVDTDESKGVFQQPLAITVEQGTEILKIQAMKANSRTAIASLKLDIQKDILASGVKHAQGETYAMKQKHKDCLNPRITMTIKRDYRQEMQRGAMLVQGMGVSKETGVVLRHQLDSLSDADPGRNRTEGGVSSEVDLLMKGCSGPLLMFGSWGSTTKVYVAAQVKQDERRVRLGVWKDKEDFERGVAPKTDIDLMKVFSVQPDPGRKEVFIIEFAPAEKERKRLMMQRLDRTRDAWVEMLTLLIKTLRSQREDNRKKVRTNLVPEPLPAEGASFDTLPDGISRYKSAPPR